MGISEGLLDQIEEAKKHFIPNPLLTVKQLLSFGFKKISSSHKESVYQYCLRDGKGIKFYVEVTHRFNLQPSITRQDVVDNLGDDAYLHTYWANCQFDLNGPKTFDVNMNVGDMSPDQIIAWFSDMFDRMGCTYYESKEEKKTAHCLKCGLFLGKEPNELYLCDSCEYAHTTGFRRIKG